jgi:uncharacterized protein (TIGR03067 family)
MSNSPVEPKTSTSVGMEQFLGTWMLVSSITDGKPAPDTDIQNVRVLISDGKETVWVGDQVIAHEIPFSIDLSITPHQTTDYLPDGQQIKGITQVEGDTLTSCVAAIGQERPRIFASTPGSGHTLRVFRRLTEYV